MPHVRGDRAEHLAPGLNFRTFNAFREKPEIFSTLVRVQGSNSAYEEDFAETGLGPLVEKGELKRTTLDESHKLGGTRIVHKSYALAFEISEEMIDDDKYNLMGDLSGSLGKSARWTRELLGHDPYNRAFSATKYVGRDGLALITASHPLVGGGTLSNLLTGDLAEGTLEDAWERFQMLTDERGMFIEANPTTLVVHPTEVLNARRLLESASLNTASLNTAGNPGVINPLQGMVRIVSSPYLSDPDAWFVIADTMEVQILFYDRKPFDTKTWDDEDADGTIHKGKMRVGVGFRDYQFIVGSAGA